MCGSRSISTRHYTASKTISSVFHLHNTSANRELSVYQDGQRLRHECHPTYLGVTLDRTLSYREYLTKTAGKLKNRNNLLMKLAGSTLAPAQTLCGHLLWRFAIQQQSTAPQSGHALLTQVRSMDEIKPCVFNYCCLSKGVDFWDRPAITMLHLCQPGSQLVWCCMC